jgi:uncharacterized protein (DUF433 family)
MAHFRPLSKMQLTLAALLVAGCAGLRAQCPLPGADGSSRLLSFTGQVSVMRGGNYAWALNTCDSVKPQEVVVTGPDGWGVFQVADGSKFEVYPNSRVVFRANQNNWTDMLEIWLGKVRVQIEHLGGLPNNNKVRTPTAVISVRGTIFDVEVEPDTHTTLVQDEEGVVVVDHVLQPSQRILHPGEYVRVYQNQPLAKAVIDKSGALQKLAQAARDAFYQAAVNRNGAVGRVPTSTTSVPGDKNGGGTPPPPVPPAPPAPPHFISGAVGEALDWSKCSAVEKARPEDGGQWVLKGTLIPVNAILQEIDTGTSTDALVKRFPMLDRTAIETVVAFALKH